MNERKWLLLGGAGFIGGNLARYLAEHGEKVVIADRKEIVSCHKNISGVVVDFYKEENFMQLLSDVKIVVFLVCNVGPQSSMNKPETSYGKNVTNLIKLLEAMRGCGVDMVFLSSGGTVYGDGYNDPIVEGDRTDPINHYGILKLAQEKIVLMYNRSFGMNNMIFRLANPYGPGQDVGSGIGAVTAFLKSVMAGTPVSLFGNCRDIVRDYIHIDDACAMIVNTVNMTDAKLNRELGSVYNIGTGVGTSVYDVLKSAEEVVGAQADVRLCKRRVADVKYNVLSNERVQRVIGGYRCRSLIEGMLDYYRTMKG